MSNGKLSQARFEHDLLQMLLRADLEARKGKRGTYDEHQFELDNWWNLCALRDSLIARTYRPGAGRTFIVHEPKLREIVAAPYRDRVVHHLIYDVCYPWWDRHFINDSYSCRVGKGTLYGIKRAQHFMCLATNNRKNSAFVVKLDLQGYFMSLDHQLLLKRAHWGLRQEFLHNKRVDSDLNCFCHPDDRQLLYRLLKFLWHVVINDLPMKYAVRRGKISDWDLLPPSKSLYTQPASRGIAIGNLTSQLLSNIYLDQLDRFITFDLGYKYYGRYVDDFYIIVPLEQKAQLLRDIVLIEKFLQNELKLTLHPHKRYYQTTDKGMDFIGARIFASHCEPSKRVKKNLLRDAELLAAQGIGDPQEMAARGESLRHLDSRAFLARMYAELGWRREW